LLNYIPLTSFIVYIKQQLM